VLGIRNREQSFARKLHLLHTRLLGGEPGEHIVGWTTVALLLLALSGLILWWPRRIVAIVRRTSWKRTTFDLHNAVGFYSLPIIAAITLSGVMIAFEATTDPLVKRLNAQSDPPPPASTPASGAHRISIDDVLREAQRSLPGAAATNVNVPAGPRAAYRVLMKFPEDRTPAGRSRVHIDQFSGRVLLVENTREAPRGTRILNLKRSVHTGDIFGAPTQALYFIVGLAIAAQALTGAIMWWNARR
jgi:uncharacterized iron-regulated membrane protein